MKKILLILIGTIITLSVSAQTPKFYTSTEILNRVFWSPSAALTAKFKADAAVLNYVFSATDNALKVRLIGSLPNQDTLNVEHLRTDSLTVSTYCMINSDAYVKGELYADSNLLVEYDLQTDEISALDAPLISVNNHLYCDSSILVYGSLIADAGFFTDYMAPTDTNFIEVVGNMRIDSNLTVNGNTTLGNAATDTTTVNGNAYFNDSVFVDGNIGNTYSHPDTIFLDASVIGGVSTINYHQSVLDDGTIVFPTSATSGYGTINIDSSGVSLIRMVVRWDATGVTYIDASYGKTYITTATSDSDGKICWFDNGASPALKPRLGYAVTAIITTWH